VKTQAATGARSGDHTHAPSAKTLTWDQGSEMAEHALIAEHFSAGVFVCGPASPWQRSTDENTAPAALPEGTELSVHTSDDLRRVEARLNNRPRKTLGWATRDLRRTRGKVGDVSVATVVKFAER
jgi:IS30 family transposase